MTEQRRYALHLNTAELGIFHAADAVLVEEAEVLCRFGFRYTQAYLAHTHAFALDPVQFPLSKTEFQLDCRNGVPGILDDYLPDDWGRKVLAQLAFYRDQCSLNRHSCIDTLKPARPRRCISIR